MKIILQNTENVKFISFILTNNLIKKEAMSLSAKKFS